AADLARSVRAALRGRDRGSLPGAVYADGAVARAGPAGDAVFGPAAQRPLALHGAERVARARRGRDRGHAAVHHAADPLRPAGRLSAVGPDPGLAAVTVHVRWRSGGGARCARGASPRPARPRGPTRARAGHRRDGGEPAPTTPHRGPGPDRPGWAA